MHMTGLEPLYRSMRQQNMGRAKFYYQLNHLRFECLFFTDTKPFELVMGCLGNNFAIFVDVLQGFEIKPFIEPPGTFHALCQALFQGTGSAHRFSATDFFAEFNRHIPQTTAPQHAPTAQDAVRYYPNTEEADKLHFCGWLDNTLRSNRVSSANLAKTRRIFGQNAHDFCQRRNLSTRWTDDPARAQAFALPS